jgi:hypothetical protein
MQYSGQFNGYRFGVDELSPEIFGPPAPPHNLEAERALIGAVLASVEQWVSVERRPCRLGGHCVYFRCPQCSCSTLNLAVLPEGLRCASCGSITWASRRERAPQRLIRRANKVARVLQSGNWDDEPEVRPPYMRIAVFHALKTERAKLAEQIYEHMDRQFMQSARVRRLLARRNR